MNISTSENIIKRKRIVYFDNKEKKYSVSLIAKKFLNIPGDILASMLNDEFRHKKQMSDLPFIGNNIHIEYVDDSDFRKWFVNQTMKNYIVSKFNNLTNSEKRIIVSKKKDSSKNKNTISQKRENLKNMVGEIIECFGQYKTIDGSGNVLIENVRWIHTLDKICDHVWISIDSSKSIDLIAKITDYHIDMPVVFTAKVSKYKKLGRDEFGFKTNIKNEAYALSSLSKIRPMDSKDVVFLKKIRNKIHALKIK